MDRQKFQKDKNNRQNKIKTKNTHIKHEAYFVLASYTQIWGLFCNMVNRSFPLTKIEMGSEFTQ